MKKLFLVFCSLIGLMNLMVAMNGKDKGWQRSDGHKLIKTKDGTVMDYSYDPLAFRWQLDSECWEDDEGNFYTRCYKMMKDHVEIHTFYDQKFEDTVLQNIQYITIEEYIELDLKKNGIVVIEYPR